MNIMITGTVMPSRKEMPEPLKGRIWKIREGDVFSEKVKNLLLVGGTNTQS
jgi:hypothetical protein